MFLGQAKDMCVAVTVRLSGRFEHDPATSYFKHRKRVLVTVCIDTDHVVQLICKHPH